MRNALSKITPLASQLTSGLAGLFTEGEESTRLLVWTTAECFLPRTRKSRSRSKKADAILCIRWSWWDREWSCIIHVDQRGRDNRRWWGEPCEDGRIPWRLWQALKTPKQFEQLFLLWWGQFHFSLKLGFKFGKICFYCFHLHAW